MRGEINGKNRLEAFSDGVVIYSIKYPTRQYY